MRKKSASKENISPRIVCKAPWRLTSIKPLMNYKIEVVFNDGTKGCIDMKKLILSDKAGIFAELKDNNLFNQAYLEHGVLTWPGEIDLAPDAMYESVKKYGQWLV